MSSYVFICDHKGDNWSAKRFSKDEDAEPLEAEASSTYELQKKLSDLAKAQGATGGVSLTFSYITQKKALCQVRSVFALWPHKGCMCSFEQSDGPAGA
jgi:hypothetical protein